MNMISKSSRRAFLQGGVFSSTAILSSFGGISGGAQNQDPQQVSSTPFDSFMVEGQHVIFYSAKIKKKTNVMVLADTHLFMDDQRGEPFKSYSDRMSKAYNHTKHFQTNEPTNPAECFVNTLEFAKQKDHCDAIALLGDIFSFPSERGVEWASQKLNACGLPWFYISGNHDWHYEGMTGSEKNLRAEWTKKRLSPMYQGRNTLAYSVDLPGVRLVMIDDSTCEILPEQLDFFKKQILENVPMVLMMHIPLYAPNRSLGFGCAHPRWNAKNDKNWKIERREHWPEKGHSAVTMEFYHDVFTAPNLLGVFAGHLHVPAFDSINGKPQFVVPANYSQNYMIAEFVPL